MTIRERFTRWYQELRSYLRPMTFRQKAAYLFTYYKSWLLGLILIAVAIGFGVEVMIQRQQETVLQGFFTNDDYGIFDAAAIRKDFEKRITLESNQNIILDDDLYIDLEGGARNYSAASNGKIIAYMSVGQVDFIVTCREIFDHYSGNVPMMDMRQLLPEDLYREMEPYLAMGRNFDEDGNLLESCPVAIELSQSRYLRDQQIPQGTYYLFVPYQAPNRDMICSFIRYSFE